MNPLAHAANVGASIALVTFLVAFVLTLWPSRERTMLAAVLYAIGTWASLGTLARNYFIMSAIAYGTSDSGSPNTGAFFWMLLPIGLGFYALIAPILLWPSIRQLTAMRYGKILNLIFIPLVAGLMYAQTYIVTRGYILADELKWLVYALMWFRIREAYANMQQS